MISEPYQKDGKWWIDGALGPIEYLSSEDAYKAYHLLKRFQDRVSGVLPPTKLHKPGPLPEVRGVTENPPPPIQVNLSPEDVKSGYERLTEAEVARIEYEKTKHDKIPLRYQFKGIAVGAILMAVAGVGAFMIKGC